MPPARPDAPLIKTRSVATRHVLSYASFISIMPNKGPQWESLRRQFDSPPGKPTSREWQLPGKQFRTLTDRSWPGTVRPFSTTILAHASPTDIRHRL